MLKSKKINNETFDIKYSNWFSSLVQLIKPQNLYVVGGRGLAKTTDILANRSIDVANSMPRAPLVFVSDTYVNLLTNIIPYIIEGWQRAGECEGYHFVVDKKPPEAFEKPIVFTTGFKHTIIRNNGTKFFLKSLDRPSVNAGISVVHAFGDETKYLKKDKINKLFPTLRGDASLYKNSPYFMGQTFLTDMPNPNNMNEDDWILGMRDNMNIEQIKLIIQASAIYNEELLNYELATDDIDRKNIKRIIERWEERLKKVRRGSTFFYKVSSFANADILTPDYFKNLYNVLGKEEFNRAVMSIEGLKTPNMFYPKLASHHFYNDGYNYDYYDKFELGSKIVPRCQGLKYLRNEQPLEAGVDFGNMISIVIGQWQGDTIRILKNFYVLPPLWLEEIADDFVSYFDTHKVKILFMYYDRAGNNYHASRQDIATQLKQKIEGKGKGWTVILKSVGQRNITHEEEYNLMHEMLSETNTSFPKIRIDANECKEYKASLEMAPAIKKDNTIKKDKSSEKNKDKAQLPTQSTNFSDAGKYFFCRTELLRILKAKPVVLSDVGVR